MKALVAKGMKLDNIVLNAGILKYPNVSEVARDSHLILSLTACAESNGNV